MSDLLTPIKPPLKERTGPKSKWEEVARALKQAPGQWSQVNIPQTEGAARVKASRIRKGNERAFRPAGQWDAAVTEGDDGHWYVLAVYMGA